MMYRSCDSILILAIIFQWLVSSRLLTLVVVSVLSSDGILTTRGVTSKVMRGIPSRVTKEKSKSKKSQIDTRGTSKESFLKGDPQLTNLIEASMHDNKPVHYISMVSEELKWIVK